MCYTYIIRHYLEFYYEIDFSEQSGAIKYYDDLSLVTRHYKYH